MHIFRVYIADSHDGALHIGVAVGSTPRYGVRRVLYQEEAPDVFAAIAREKQLRRWSRSRKARLISVANPSWRDLTARSRSRPPCRRA